MEKEKIMLNALRSISALWPEPPNCADVMSVNGINDGRMRAIGLDAALKIARKAISDVDNYDKDNKTSASKGMS